VSIGNELSVAASGVRRQLSRYVLLVSIGVITVPYLSA
jgi:hypothetical protein